MLLCSEKKRYSELPSKSNVLHALQQNAHFTRKCDSVTSIGKLGQEAVYHQSSRTTAMAVEVSPIVAGDLLNSVYMMAEATYIAECAPLQDNTHSYQESLFNINISWELFASYYDWDAQRMPKEYTANRSV